MFWCIGGRMKGSCGLYLEWAGAGDVESSESQSAKVR